jgi:hypothetical protein
MSFIQTTKQFLSKHARSAINTVTVIALVIASFKLGAEYGNRPKPEEPKNPYAHAFAPDEISIAVNESNELIMIERATGQYIVYSDEIGQTIFGMYANRIHQEVKNAE